MAQITNLHSRYDQGTNVREDLEDVIYDISPEETPFVSSIGTVKASNTFHEWMTDSLAAANANNAAIEGDQASAAALTARSRVGNYTQIYQKTVSVSGTAVSVNTAGVADELKFQLAKAGRELKRDIEASFVGNNGAVAGNDTTARKSAGLETMTVTNIASGASGSTAAWSSGAATTAPTDGTQRAFTETLLKGVLATGVANGMTPKLMLLGPAQKQVFSSFAGIAVNRLQLNKPEQGTIIGAADIYVSDFGQISVAVDLFQRNRTALLVDPEYAKRAVLRPMSKKQLATNGDYEIWQMLTEQCLVVSNEKAHGKVADLT